MSDLIGGILCEIFACRIGEIEDESGKVLAELLQTDCSLFQLRGIRHDSETVNQHALETNKWYHWNVEMLPKVKESKYSFALHI